MKTQFTVFLILMLFHFQAKTQIMIGQTEVDTSTIVTGLDIPWEILWGPDDFIWVTERYGRVSRINPQTGEQLVILDITSIVYQSQESGLLGMVLHPDFDLNPIVYFAYTYHTGSEVFEKIVSYEYTGSQLINEVVIFDSIPGASSHDGCRIVISTDNKLFISTGDAQNQAAAQDTSSLNGKILRINLDGSIPSDNPWQGNPIYSFGHRNPQGLFFGPNGILYSSEHGPSNDDEINIIEPGRNYGWPNIAGYCITPADSVFCTANNVAEPLIAWTPTIATSDIVYYDHPAIPEWQGHILLTTLKNKTLHVLELDETGTSVLGDNNYFEDYWGRLRDVCIGPEGEIYLANNYSNWGGTQPPFTNSIIKVWAPRIKIDLKAYLEGPFDTLSLDMKTDLNSNIPNDQPFGPNLPYFGNPMPDWYYNGTENVIAIPNPDIVDWVMVELRDATSVAAALPDTEVARQAAFITRTGQIVDLDGSGSLSFPIKPVNNLYAVIWSRNHLGVISANSLSETNGLYTYDFSSGSGQAYGADSQKELTTGSGIWGLISGDGNGDGIISDSDKTGIWNMQTGNYGYHESDYNMSSQSENTDKNNFWQPNIGSESTIPE